MANLGKVTLVTEDFVIVETIGDIKGKKRKVKIDACYFHREADGVLVVERNAVIEELH